MARTLSSPNAGSTIVDKLKVYEGGTGATSAAAAAAALNAIALSEVGAPGGVAALDSSGKLPGSTVPDSGVATINVTGPTEVVIGQMGQYTITNYDVFTTYELAAIRGSVFRIGKTIYYTAPEAVGDGSGGFTINGRTVNVVTDSIRPSPPVISVRDVQGTSATAAALNVAASAFVMNSPSAATHLNSDWQVATDSAFNNIVSQSLNDATNKDFWISGDVNLTTTYYVRARYRDSNNGVGKWSNTVTVTTKATYKLDVEQAVLLPTVRNANVQFGGSVATNRAGNRIVIGARYERNVNNQANAGAIYVFYFNGSNWVQEAKLEPSTPLGSSNDSFGVVVSMSEDGTRVAAGSARDTGSAGNATGAVYVFVRNGTTWTQEARIADPDPTFTAGVGGSTESLFGERLEMDASGTRIVIGSYANDTTVTNGGRVYVYTRTGTSWAREASLAPPADIRGGSVENLFGLQVTISGDGSRVGVSTRAYNGSGADKRIAIYSRTNTTWTFEQYITYPNLNGDLTCSLDHTGTRIAVGRLDETVSFSSDGAVYIWTRSGTTWTQEQKLTVTPNTQSGNTFGRSVKFNRDGSSLVALRQSDNGASYGSAMYNYTRVGTVWTLNKKFNGATVSGQSLSVTISGDGSVAAMGVWNATVNSITGGAVPVFVS